MQKENSEWVAVKEAAEIMGISERAVRGRIERGTLKHKKRTVRGLMEYLVLRTDAENNPRKPTGRKPGDSPNKKKQ